MSTPQPTPANPETGTEQAGVSVARSSVLWALVRGHRTAIIFVLLLDTVVGLLEGATMAFIALGVAAALDGTLGNTPLPEPLDALLARLTAGLDSGQLFVGLILLAVAAQLLRSVATFASMALNTWLRATVETDVQRRVFHQVATMSYATLMQYKHGALSESLSRVGSVNTLLRAVETLTRDGIVTLFYAGLLVLLAPRLTLLSVIVLLPTALFVRLLLTRIRQRANQAQIAQRQAQEALSEQVQGMYVVRAFGEQERVSHRVDAILQQKHHAVIRGGLWDAAARPIQEGASVLLAAALLLVSYQMSTSIGSTLFLTETMAFVLVLWRTLGRLTGLTRSVVQIVGQLPIVAALLDFLESSGRHDTPDGTRPPPPLRHGITLDNLVMRYTSDGPHVLHGLSLTLPKGKTTALVGESGAGKSTIVHLLLRLYEPMSGRILVDEVPLSDVQRNAWRQRVAVVPQDPFMFHTTVRENIAFSKPDASDEEIVAAATAANAHGFICQLPDGYDTVVGDRGHRLSGGQRQRLALARALVRDADLLILDEATSNLDSESEQLIQEAMVRLGQERTVLIVAHRLSTICHADQIVVLRAGTMVECGTHQQLLAQKGLYARFWGLQTAPATPQPVVNGAHTAPPHNALTAGN